MNGFMSCQIQYSKDVNFSQIDIRFSTIPIKTPARIFVDMDKIIPKFKWKDKGTRIVQTILKE